MTLGFCGMTSSCQHHVRTQRLHESGEHELHLEAQAGHAHAKGLLYSMNSFPRIAWTMGAFGLLASSISSVWAPARQAPKGLGPTSDISRRLGRPRQPGLAAPGHRPRTMRVKSPHLMLAV